MAGSFTKITKVMKLLLEAACNSIYRNRSPKTAWFVKQYVQKCEKSRDMQHVKYYQLPIFILTQNWKLNIAIIKIVTKN